MELKNGYKVIYDTAANGEHVFSASKTGIFSDAEELGRFAEGKYKLIYEKDGHIYGSETGIPADDDYCFEEFDAVLVVTEEDEPTNEPTNEPTGDVVVEEPEVGNAPAEDPTIDPPTLEEEDEE